MPNDDEDEDDLDEDDGFMDTDGFDAEGEDYDLDFDLDGDEVDLASDVNAFIESGGGTRGHEGIDLAADVDAFMALFGSGRNPPRYPPEVNLAADANAFMREYTAGRNRDGSEAEVSQDLNADVEDDVVEDRAMWEAAEDEAMENWGLSHSDGDASESLSEGELFGSMEDDMHVQDDGMSTLPSLLSVLVWILTYRHYSCCSRGARLTIGRRSPGSGDKIETQRDHNAGGIKTRSQLFIVLYIPQASVCPPRLSSSIVLFVFYSNLGYSIMHSRPQSVRQRGPPRPACSPSPATRQ